MSFASINRSKFVHSFEGALKHCKSCKQQKRSEGMNVNKKTPEGAYAGCVGFRKNYGYVGWKWKLSSVCNKCVQERRRCSVKD